MTGTHARRGRGLVALALAALVIVGVAAELRRAAAWAIVEAPSFDGARAAEAIPDDVAGVIRADVGPPAATLDAWILEPSSEPRATTLVLHGVRDDKRSMLGIGRALRARGHRAILVDLRGHGASTGRFLTYGVRESRDLAQLLDQLDALGLVEGPLGIYGPSYGGAVAIQTAARDPRVERVVSVATFASLRRAVPPQARLAIPIVGRVLPGALVDLAVEDAGELAGFAPDDADTVAAIARARAEVLLIHGREDAHVPFDSAVALSGACGPRRCRLVSLDGADHAGALSADETRERAIEFLSRGALVARAPTTP